MAGAVLKVPRRCMGRLRGFGLTGATLFLWRAPNPELHEGRLQVGYKKPLKTTNSNPALTDEPQGSTSA